MKSQKYLAILILQVAFLFSIVFTNVAQANRPVAACTVCSGGCASVLGGNCEASACICGCDDPGIGIWVTVCPDE